MAQAGGFLPEDDTDSWTSTPLVPRKVSFMQFHELSVVRNFSPATHLRMHTFAHEF